MLGYLQVRKHVRKLVKLDKPDYVMKKFLADENPSLKNRIFFGGDIRTGRLCLYEQMVNERVPLVKVVKYGQKYNGISIHCPLTRAAV
jgi:hypothetical protein